MMKLYKLIICLVIPFALLGCQDDAMNAGSSTLLESDDIQVKADTFSLASALDSCVALTLTPDSFLLGECDTHFGTIHADILTKKRAKIKRMRAGEQYFRYSCFFRAFGV